MVRLDKILDLERGIKKSEGRNECKVRLKLKLNEKK